jgi:hypothetical protein
MNEYIQFEDVLASPVTGIQGVARESRSEEARRRGSGKHRLATSSHRQAAGFRPFRSIAVVVSTAALAVAAFAVTTSHGAAPSPARAQATISTTLNSTSPVAVAAKYVKSLDPSMKLSTDQLAKLITELRARVRNAGPARPQQLQATSSSTRATLDVSYWNHTYWFGHWDVAMMAGLSAVAVVALLLTTGPIGVGTAWAIVGTVMSIIATAFFSGYCAYYVTTQHRGGLYHC